MTAFEGLVLCDGSQHHGVDLPDVCANGFTRLGQGCDEVLPVFNRVLSLVRFFDLVHVDLPPFPLNVDGA